LRSTDDDGTDDPEQNISKGFKEDRVEEEDKPDDGTDLNGCLATKFIRDVARNKSTKPRTT
jgi:hypothetical protein